MNDIALVDSLRRITAVDAAAVARLQQWVRSLPRAPSLAVAGPKDVRAVSRTLWLALAASGVTALLAFVLWQRPSSTDSAPATALEIRQREAAANPDFEEPPGLSGLLNSCDLVVEGRVEAVHDGQVRFLVAKVLRGDATLMHLQGQTDPARVGVGRELPWQVGARGLLFLVRSSKSGELEVLHGEQGFEAPSPRGYWDLLTLADVEAAIETHTLPAASILALIKERGPKVLGQVMWHCQSFAGWRMPIDAPGFQSALVAWWEGARAPSEDPDSLLAAAGYLEPTELLSLSSAAMARHQAGWETASAARGARFIADVYLGPAARARLPWAREQVLAVLRQVEAENATRGRLSLHVRYHVELLQLLAHYDVVDAAERARQLLTLVPQKEREDRDRLLIARLAWQPESTAGEVIAEFEREFRAGQRRVPLGPLLACSAAAAADTLRSAVLDPRFGELFLGYDAVLRDVLERTSPNAVLAEVRDELRVRVCDSSMSFDAFRNFLRLHLAAGGSIAGAEALPHHLIDGFASGFAGQEFVRDVEKQLGLIELHFADPTAGEVAEAASRLAKRWGKR